MGLLRRVLGRRVLALDEAELAALFANHARAVIDVGTGNGRPILLRAAAEPTTLALGIDADAAAMAEASRRAARSPTKGGLPNALFLVAAVETLPEPLGHRFDEVTVLFPWGSLLRGIVAAEPALLGGLVDLLTADGRLTIMLSLTEHDAGLGGVPTSLDRDALGPLTSAAAAAGLDVVGCRLATRDEVLATGSSWSKRIRAGTPARPAWLVRAVKPGISDLTSHPAAPVRQRSSGDR
jgi:16S rRNA (adenine(1408)-N(1))-methyltransferase